MSTAHPRLAPSARRVLATTARAWNLPRPAAAADGMPAQGMAAALAAGAAAACALPRELSLAARRMGDQRCAVDRQRELPFSQWPYWPAYPGLAAEWR